MVQFHNLPIYIKTYEFIKLIYRLVGQFRKEYKFTLGTELQQIGWKVLDEIIATNSLPDSRKRDGIERMNKLFDKFKIRFRLAYELDLVSDKKFGAAQKEMEEIGKMIGGWLRWAASR